MFSDNAGCQPHRQSSKTARSSDTPSAKEPRGAWVRFSFDLSSYPISSPTIHLPLWIRGIKNGLGKWQKSKCGYFILLGRPSVGGGAGCLGRVTLARLHLHARLHAWTWARARSTEARTLARVVIARTQAPFDDLNPRIALMLGERSGC